MSKWMTFLCCAMLAAAPSTLAQAQGNKVDAKEQAALAKKKKDAAEQKDFMARVTQCDQKAKDRRLKGNDHKNFMRDCMKG